MAGVHHTEPLLDAFSPYTQRRPAEYKEKHWTALKPTKAEPT